jgi:hypothetical protein
MSKINADKFGGPYEVIETEEELRRRAAARRANDRYICETIIEENEDPKAVECAKQRLAELDAKEGRGRDRRLGRGDHLNPARMVEQREAREKAKLVALEEAAAVGFRDIDEGRFHDVGERALEEFVGDLGQQASKRATTTSR